MACECGNNRFAAHQQVHVDVIVSDQNMFLDNLCGTVEKSIYEAGKPYGGYTCLNCKKEHENLPQFPEKMAHEASLKMFKIKEAAEVLGLSEGVIRRQVASGEIPSVRISQRIIRIPAAKLKQAIRQKQSKYEEQLAKLEQATQSKIA